MKPLDQLKKEAEARCWQDISTAPKDGRRVLLWNECWSASNSGQYYGNFWGNVYDNGAWKSSPTHWKPLCAPDNDIIQELLATIEVLSEGLGLAIQDYKEVYEGYDHLVVFRDIHPKTLDTSTLTEVRLKKEALARRIDRLTKARNGGEND